jgi:CzcA family heavy metal efflux pump
MLQALVDFSLRFRGIVVLLAGLVMADGIYDAFHAKLDVFPDFVPPEVVVQTEAPGLTSEQVESLVTRPIESAIDGLGNQQALRSESIPGLSVVTVVFKEGTPILPARQLLAERLTEVSGEMPAGVQSPKMEPLTSATMDLLKIGLVSDQLTPMQLRTFADWTLKPRLLAVSGVAKCSVFGGDVRQWQIVVNPDLLVAHDVSLTEVLDAARAASGVLGAGFIETGNQRIDIQTDGQSLSATALGDIVVTFVPGAGPVRIKDLATVRAGAAPKFGEALIMGRPGVLLTMSSQYGANTMDATRALEAALADLRPVFQKLGITLYGRLHRPATFIEVSLANIRHSLLLGAVLVMVVLFIFLGHFRTALISITAIPLSLLAAIMVMDRLGITLNTITLGGLAIAIGAVVDDAIIDVENILRRLRENQAQTPPRLVHDVILEASLEVRSAVVYATFVVVLVFLPVLALTGVAGSFFAPLALSYIFAILASLVVALTVTPALTYLFFSRGADAAEAPWLQRCLRGGYERLLAAVARRPRPVIAVVVLLCLWALSRLPYFGGELLPEFREGHYVLSDIALAPGSSLAETMRVGKIISGQLLQNPSIATVSQQIGRAEQGEDTWGPYKSEFHVELKPNLPGNLDAQVGDQIRAVLKNVPGIQYEVLTFLGDRLGETIGGETAPVVINIFGTDLDALDATGAQIAALLTNLGANDVQMQALPGAPQLSIRLRGERLTELGFRPVAVLEALQTAFQGTVVGQVYQNDQVSDIAVTLAPLTRPIPAQVGELLLRNGAGQLVPLRELADITLGTGRFSILHEGARRRQTVTCDPGGRDVVSFVDAAKKAIADKILLPPGVYVEFAGAAEATQSARQELLLNSGIALLGILMLLYVVLGRARNLALVLLNLPFALVGGVLAVYITGLLGAGGHLTWATLFGFGPVETPVILSMGSLVGFVTLFGITTRNTVMLLSHYQHLVAKEGQPWNTATVVRGAGERLAPILMTALVTALGLLPLAVGSGEAGREIEGPMAVVILGGLITSTALNLLVMPALAESWFTPVRPA